MRNTIRYVDPSHPIVSKATAVPLDYFRIFLLEVHRRGLLIGSGSPEGVVEAQQGAEYMDEDGMIGTILWIKQKADIAGNRTQGWIAIG